MRVARELQESLKAVGFGRTLNIIWGRWIDAAFDWRYGTDTVQRLDMKNLDVASPTKAHAQRYQPTGVRAVRDVFRRLQFPHDAVFVDYGCGKGRVLLLAAAYGFKRVVGIEFAPALCAIARANMIAFGRRRLISPVEIVEGDVCDYRLRGDESVFYYFHPFDSAILARTVDAIAASLRDRRRRAWIVYYLPRHAEVLDSRPEFRRSCVAIFGEYEGIVYEYVPAGTGTSGGVSA